MRGQFTLLRRSHQKTRLNSSSSPALARQSALQVAAQNPSSSSTSPKDSGKLHTATKKRSDEMIVWWSAGDDAYVVDVPELPGCMAHGSTRPTAIRNAEDAIKLRIKTTKDDGKEIPQPRGPLLIAKLTSGAIAIAKNGDPITIDAEKREVTLEVLSAELKRRKKAWRKPAPR